MGADPLTGEGFLLEARDDVQVRVKHLLSGNGATVPTKVVAVRREAHIQPCLGTAQEVEGRRRLCVIEIEHGLYVANRDDEPGTSQWRLVPILLKEQAQVVSKQHPLTGIAKVAEGAAHVVAPGARSAGVVKCVITCVEYTR